MTCSDDAMQFDAVTGRPRCLPAAELTEWARAISSTSTTCTGIS
jgi:hypothetical protein